MTSRTRTFGPLVACAITLMAGCTHTSPASTVSNQPAPNTTRSLMAVDQATLPDALTDDQARAQLPARISVADANRMLIQINGSQISRDQPTYSLQARGGGHGGGGHGGHGGGGHGGHGFGHGHGFGRFNNFGGFGFGGWGGLWGSPWLWGYGWPSYGFYGLGDYYYPYYLNSGYYYPYSYSPFLYRRYRWYYPYY